MKINKNSIFFITFFFLTIVSCCELFFGNGLKYYFHQNNLDSFMDLFNSIISEKQWGGHPGIYPPLAIFPYKLFARIVPWSFINESLPIHAQALQLRMSVPGTFILLLHILFFIVPLCLSIFSFIHGSLTKKIACSLAVTFSGIVLFSLERGNIVVYSFLFTLLFVFLYQSESRRVQKFACFCLAIATGLKLYPGIFGLLLLEKKDWEGIIVCIVSFWILYISLFILCGYSINDFGRNFVNVLTWGNKVSSGNDGAYSSAMGLNCSIKNLFLSINKLLFKLSHGKIPMVDSPVFYVILKFLCFCLGIFSCFFSDEIWKKNACLALMCIYIPSVSFLYVMLFLLIPLLLFLDKEIEKKIDILYAIAFGFIVAMVIVPVKMIGHTYFITAGFLLQCICMFVMFMSLVYNAFRLCVNGIVFKEIM